MNNKEEQVEIFDSEEVITFSDDEGNSYSYVQVACVEHDGEFFVLLEPADEAQAEEGLYIFKILNYENVDEDWEVEPVMDEKLANVIYDKFIEVYEAQCGGNCASCSANCPSKEE